VSIKEYSLLWLPDKQNAKDVVKAEECLDNWLSVAAVISVYTPVACADPSRLGQAPIDIIVQGQQCLHKQQN